MTFGPIPRRRSRCTLALGIAFGVSVMLSVGCTERPKAGRFKTPPPPTPTAIAPGETLYVANCEGCHGHYGLGTRQGPPLVHAIYAPSHHADVAFVLAVQRGVRAHHWTFGDMPAVPTLDEDQIYRIVRYVRWLQGESEFR